MVNSLVNPARLGAKEFLVFMANSLLVTRAGLGGKYGVCWDHHKKEHAQKGWCLWGIMNNGLLNGSSYHNYYQGA